MSVTNKEKKNNNDDDDDTNSLLIIFDDSNVCHIVTSACVTCVNNREFEKA